MKVWVNWKTKKTHLTRDCHQLARVPEDVAWLELQEGTPEEILDGYGRNYCGWCVSRLLRAADAAGVEPGADLHPPAQRADYKTAPVG